MNIRKPRTRARQYPNGRIREDDEGQLAIRVAADRKRDIVLVEFPYPVKWFGLPKREALELAESLRRRAAELPDTPPVNSPPAEDVQ